MTLSEMNGVGHKKSWIEHYLMEPDCFENDIECMDVPYGGVAHTLWRGTFPGLLDAPDNLVPDFMRSYVETYVERDVRVMGNINDLSDFGRFLRLSAALSSCEINTAQFGREIGINPKTARTWLRILEHSYQWMELSPYHGNTIKRISRKPKGCIRDTGLACFLMGISSPSTLSAHPSLGNLFEAWVACWLSRITAQLSMPPHFYHWRSSGGSEVDIVMERDGFLYPVEVKCKTTLSAHDARGIRAFRETYGDIVKRGIVVYAGQECYPVSDVAVAVPWTAL